MKPLFTSLLCVLSPIGLSGQEISGRIQNERGEPLPWVSVFVLDSKTGTSSNDQGDYTLRLSSASYTIVFRCLGYITDSVRVQIPPNADLKHDVTLKENPLQLSDVTVYGDTFSEAERIVRSVIKHKGEYLERLRNYVYECYTKTTLTVSRGDSAILAGILQTQSRAYFQYPNDFKEIILAKKQTANFSEAHNIFTLGRVPNFLNDNVKVDERECPSPLSEDALTYYAYTILDTSVYDGIYLFTLRFEPKSSALPLFSGQIKVLDEVFAVVHVLADGGPAIKTATRRDVIIEEEFREFDGYFWLPIHVRMNSHLDLGIPGIPPVALAQWSLISNYALNRGEFPIAFDNISLMQGILDPASADSLWKFGQVIPLSEEEEREVVRIDSVVANAGVFNKALLGLVRATTQLTGVPVTHISDFYHFNRVHGSYIGIGFDSKAYVSPLRMRATVGTGLASRKTDFSLELDASITKTLSLSGIFSRRLRFLDHFYDYSVDDITLQSLFGRNDYADYYFAREISLGGDFRHDEFELSVGLATTQSYNARSNSDYSLFGRNVEYRSNHYISEGTFRTLGLSVGYDSREYVDFGFLTSPDNTSDYTRIRLEYMGNDSRLFTDNRRFHVVRTEVSFFFRPTAFTESQVGGVAAHFAGQPVLQYLVHLPGSYGSLSHPFLFRTIREDVFAGVDCVAGFSEINFKNLPFAALHIPVLSTGPYDLLIFFNHGLLDGDRIDNFNNMKLARFRISEAGFGIGNILAFLRLDFAWGWSTFASDNFAISLSSKFSL